MKTLETKEPAATSKTKKPYKKPALATFGSVSKLTQKTGTATDGLTGRQPKKPPG